MGLRAKQGNSYVHCSRIQYTHAVTGLIPSFITDYPVQDHGKRAGSLSHKAQGET